MSTSAQPTTVIRYKAQPGYSIVITDGSTVRSSRFSDDMDDAAVLDLWEEPGFITRDRRFVAGHCDNATPRSHRCHTRILVQGSVTIHGPEDRNYTLQTKVDQLLLLWISNDSAYHFVLPFPDNKPACIRSRTPSPAPGNPKKGSMPVGGGRSNRSNNTVPRGGRGGRGRGGIDGRGAPMIPTGARN